MLTHREDRLGHRTRMILLAALAGAAIALSASPAAAQGFFDSLFKQRPTPPSAPAYSNPFGDFFNPFGSRPEPPRQDTGGAVAYCVRTCDGRYFPIQRTAGVSPAQQCNSFCPASATKIYNGSSIDHAVGNDGKPYSELSTAFVYREKIVSGCTCNGKDSFGIVTPPLQNDATLRQGDIVATNSGLMAYSGLDARRHAQFTPIDMQRLSAEMRQKLADTKVDPAETKPTPMQVSPKGQGDDRPAVRNGRNKRVQVSR